MYHQHIKAKYALQPSEDRQDLACTPAPTQGEGGVIPAKALSVADLRKILVSRLVGSCLRFPLMAMHLHYTGHHESSTASAHTHRCSYYR